MRLGFVGGTGPLGRGLASRLARAGHDVVLGSRHAERADEVAAPLGLEGAANAEACRAAEVVFVTVPFDAQTQALADLADECRGKVVVSTVVPMAFDGAGPRPVEVPEGSAAEQCAALLSGARVVSAFQLVPAPELLKPDVVLDMDVPVCGDDEESVALVAELVAAIAALRPVLSGPLRLSRSVEGLTPLLLSVNRRYKAHTGLRLAGLPPAPAGVTPPR